VSSKPDRSFLKAVLNSVAFVLVVPGIASFAIRCRLLGRDRALQGSSQAWALVPGLLGQYLRRAFYRRTLKGFGSGSVVEFGAVFSKADCVLGDHVYIGPYCQLGLVTIEEGALIAAGAHVPSGSQTHGLERLDIPIRDQEGEVRRVRIGSDAWVGSNAVVMADIGDNSVVAAGAVVIEAVPANAIVGGVPARVIKMRR
jgi:virginiamycin A acetyltransferase